MNENVFETGITQKAEKDYLKYLKLKLNENCLRWQMEESKGFTQEPFAKQWTLQSKPSVYLL